MRAILRKAGIDPAPRRGDQIWAPFLKAQASGILAADFFHVETITFARLYCFAIVEHASRRVHVLGVTANPVARWRSRFLARRLDGLSDEPRPRVPRTITDAQVEEVAVRTLEEAAGRGHALVQA